MTINNALRNAVFLEQLKAGELENLQSYYRQIDSVIRDLLSRDDIATLSRKNYKKLLSQLKESADKVMSELVQDVNERLIAIAEYEATFEEKNLATVTDSKVKSVAKKAIIAALAIIPLQVTGKDSGKTVAETLQPLAYESQTLVNAVKVGVAQGKTNAEIITAIRGTKANRYTDGALNTSRKAIDSTVRTLIAHSATVAKQEVYKANSDLVIGEQWVSTLDRRTTATCRYLDGKIFKQGIGPRPPIHYNCRSIIVPVTKLTQAFNKDATRASETGQVAAGLTYYDWLKNQSTAFQNQVLGMTRAKLFRDGGLSVKQFAELQLDRNYRPITLQRMKELESLAFEKAGLTY